MGQPAQPFGTAPLITQLFIKAQAALDQVRRVTEAALRGGNSAGGGEGGCSEGGRASKSTEAFQPAPSLTQRATHHPEPLQGECQTQAAIDIAALLEPLQHRP